MAQGVASAPALQQDYAEQGGPSEPKLFAAAGAAPPHLWRDRPRHQQLPAADRAADRRRLHRHRRLFAHRPAGRGPVAHRRAVARRRWTARSARCRSAPTSCGAATSRCRARSRPRPAAAPTNGARVRRAGARPRPASSSTSSSPQEEARLAVLGCHKLLEPGDGPALIFDIGGGSTELVLIDQDDGDAADPRLVERAVGRRLADRERRQGSARRARTGSRPTSGCASARAAPSRSFATMLPEKREGIRLLGTSGTVTTLASVHLALAVLRPPRGRRAPRADRGDAEDQRDDRRHGL